ncbi:Sec-independent protein translocase protein TatB [Thiogranum longum]
MFDIGFWELTVIAIVALLVVGPEKLPRVARSAGLWVGKARRFVSSVKADIDRELAADELKKALAKQAESTGLHEIIEETRKSIQPDESPSVKREQGTATIPNKPAASTKAEEPSAAITSKSNDSNSQ